MKIPKLLSGFAIAIIGALLNSVSTLAIVGAPMVKLGIATMAVGLAAKGIRSVKKKSMNPFLLFQHEKALLDKVKKGGSK